LGFPLNAVRELKFLKCLQHKNIVQLKDVVNSKGCDAIEKETKTDTNRSEDKKSTKDQDRHESEILSACGNIYLVFEFVEHDLGGLLDAKYKFSIREVKCIAKQLFEVLEFLSEKKILHRDIKSSNILITNRHQVKLADFGLARSIMSADGRDLRLDLTNNVVTMWYKAPELLLGAVRYAHSIDVWSTGCVIAELELGRPLFPGRTDIEQMDLVCRTLGTPSEDIWTGLQKMPAYESVLLATASYSSTFRSSISGRVSDSLIDLLERILVFDPSRRASAKIVLTNKYFLTQPLPPIDPTDLEPLNVTAGVSYHEYRTKQMKRQRENEKASDLPIAQFSTGSAEEVQNGGLSVSVQQQASVPRPPPPPGVPPPAAPVVAPAYGVGSAAGIAMGGYGAPILAAAGTAAYSAPGTVLPAAGSNGTSYGAPIATQQVHPPVVTTVAAYGAAIAVATQQGAGFGNSAASRPSGGRFSDSVPSAAYSHGQQYAGAGVPPAASTVPYGAPVVPSAPHFPGAASGNAASGQAPQPKYGPGSGASFDHRSQTGHSAQPNPYQPQFPQPPQQQSFLHQPLQQAGHYGGGYPGQAAGGGSMYSTATSGGNQGHSQHNGQNFYHQQGGGGPPNRQWGQQNQQFPPPVQPQAQQQGYYQHPGGPGQSSQQQQFRR
jgi:cyclin-dependent kinase 12/13